MNITATYQLAFRIFWALIFFFLFSLLFAVVSEYSSRLDMLSLAEAQLQTLNERRGELLSSIQELKEDEKYKAEKTLRSIDSEMRKLNDYQKKIAMLNTVGAPTRDFTLRSVIKLNTFPSFQNPYSFSANANDRDSPMIVKQGEDGQMMMQPNPNQLPQVDTYDTVTNVLRSIYIDVPGMSLNSLTVILLFSCSWIGHLAVSFKNGRTLGLDSTIYVSAIGLFLYLAVKGGGVLLIANTGGKGLLYNPFGLALMSMFLGAYTEDAYRIFRRSFQSITAREDLKDHG